MYRDKQKPSSKTDEKEKEEKEKELDVVVIDLGSGFIKAGWAGEDAPRAVIPTLVVDSQGPMPAQMENKIDSSMEFLVGQQALKALHAASNTSSNLGVIYPIQRGKIVDMEALEKLLEHLYKTELRIDPSKYPVLVTNVPLTTKADRAKLAKMFFKNLKVPSLFIANSAVLSLYASGLTRGIVLELGEGVTHAVPVFEGFALDHATLRLSLAGRDLTKMLMKILSEREINFTDSHLDIVRDIKEKKCRVQQMDKLYGGLSSYRDDSDNENDDDRERNSNNHDSSNHDYELPDGQIIRIDHHARYTTSEVLFDPRLLGDDDLNADAQTVGVHKMTYNSILKCDSHLRKDLFQNIVLAGGTSMLKGFGTRMRQEINNLVEGHQVVDLVLDSQRKYAAWIGGSIFASLATFSQLKYTNTEYRSDPNIVHKKYF